jgi:site-specific DNA recombinase
VNIYSGGQTTMTTATDTLIKNVGVLLRISREQGEGRDTLLSHRTIAERFCKNKGYNYKVYEEVISGAKNIEERECNRQVVLNTFC